MPIRVNGELITDEAIRAHSRVLRQQHADEMADYADPIEGEQTLRDAATASLIERTLLRQQAALDPTPVPEADIERTLAEWRSQTGGNGGCDPRLSPAELRAEVEQHLRVQRVLTRGMGRPSLPRPKEVSDFYRRHRDDFRAPERVHCAHIVKHIDEQHTEEQAHADMAAAQEELSRGEPFDVVADRHSDCPGEGGDLGEIVRGQMVPEFEEVVFSLPSGQNSPVFRTVFGLHIARVERHFPAGVRAFEEVRERIERAMYQMRLEANLERFLSDLHDAADIESLSRRDVRP